MQRKSILLVVAAAAALILIWYFYPSKSSSTAIQTEVKSGPFVISVNTTGELDAKNSTEINGPTSLENIGIWSDIKLENIVEEGTVVDSGEYIASLDKTVVLNKLKEIDANLDKLNSQITNLKLDSALNLRAARDNLVNLKYATEEAKLEVENSKFEPPATQRKVEIAYEKSVRNLEQAEENYNLKRNKEETTIQQVMIDFNANMNTKNQTMAVLDEFTIKAPQAGMVIYAKSWRGEKIKAGSMISPWRPVVAKLPDLTRMLVKTYVNEIDISKVKVGQEVTIGVDAFPGKTLTGKITSVANIGEELKNSTAHVFEVIIDVFEQDADLRPAMTTKNKIVTDVLENVTYISLESLNTLDSIQFVYTDGVKKEVKTAQSNDESIIVTEGLKPGDIIYLFPPEGAEDWKMKRLSGSK